MESILENKFWITRLSRRLKKTGDSEPEQAIIRLIVAAILLIYFCLPWEEGEKFSNIFDSTPNIIIVSASSLAFLIFAAIVKYPVPSPRRRVIGITLDLVSLSIVMFWTGGDHIPLFVFYLWVILGNGFRYGLPYLYISYGLSLAGFFMVVAWSEYWQQHQSFAISLAIILIALPLYSAVLLKKLHSAIAMAKQADQAKSRFLANMSHELRTPLNGVIGMGDLLKETKLNTEQNELINTLDSSANALLELIENILDIAKIEAGKITIDSKPLDLHALVNSVIYMLSPMGNKKGLIVFCTIDPDTPFSLIGDQQHLRQVLINLVNNAIKFTDEGTVNLHVYRKGGSDLKPVICFDVIDTGIGIPANSLSNIFDDFTQAETQSTRSYGGTGLGTTISKELVELMGGQIGVESEEFKGSRFWFELEMTTTPHDDNSISANHILLLGSEETASSVRPALKSWEIRFDWVRSSARALSLLIQAAEQGNHYNSIIVDQAAITDINPEQFAQMIRSESLLDMLSLILVNSSDTMININHINHYYISTIIAPEDKRSLFNAIHAAQSVHITDNNVITLADHYSKQAGARSLNILVGEDNPVNRQVINGILKHAGHSVMLAENGENVLDILSADLDKFDMLIVDMNMPGISGTEVVKALRFMDASHSMPIVMLTADATPEARQNCLYAGASAFLTKPINSRILLEKIAELSRLNTSDKSQSIPSKGSTDKNIKASRSRSSSSSPWYNEIALKELSNLGDDSQFIQSLVKNFVVDGLKHINHIKIASSNDYLDFREALHALKGSSTEFGAIKLVEICLKGEEYKPYDIGTKKLEFFGNDIEDIFVQTSKALSKAVDLEVNAKTGLPS